ncbi:unnamed protein product, partial [Closterium sp. NIES-64]
AVVMGPIPSMCASTYGLAHSHHVHLVMELCAGGGAVRPHQGQGAHDFSAFAWAQQASTHPCAHSQVDTFTHLSLSCVTPLVPFLPPLLPPLFPIPSSPLRPPSPPSQHVHLVMELCAGGELFDRIKAKGRYSEPQAAAVVATVARVLQQCHAAGVIHRDVKPENILLCTKQSDTDVKLIDFGVATFFQPGVPCTDMAGSPYYLAPEVLAESYGPEADVWSTGVVLYILLSGLPPFWAPNNEAIFQAIKAAPVNLVRPPWPSVSGEVRDLVRRMLEKRPEDRITLAEVLEHPWILRHTRASAPSEGSM